MHITITIILRSSEAVAVCLELKKTIRYTKPGSEKNWVFLLKKLNLYNETDLRKLHGRGPESVEDSLR